MKNVFKRIILCSMVILSFVFISACGKDDDTGDSNITPTFESFEIVGEYSESLSFNKNNNSFSTLSSNNEENPFEEGKKTIEEKINEVIDIGEQITIDYETNVNEYVYAITKIKNPSNKTISSITISGQKYTSNLFKADSTKEKIIIKINVGNEIGLKDYSLEVIKYIDGTTTKDITIEGDVKKTIKVGEINDISYSLSDLAVARDSASFSFRLTDNDKIIESTKGKVVVVLYDGDNIISQKTLTIGKQSVKLEGMTVGKKYQYAIVATYDKLNGQGKKHYILEKNVLELIDFDLVSIEVLEENLFEGKLVEVELKFSNPSNIEIKEIYLNNTKSTIVSNSYSSLIVNSYFAIENGKYYIELTKVVVETNKGELISLKFDSGIVSSVNVFPRIMEVVGVAAYDNQYDYITQERDDIVIKLNNPYEYNIYELTIDGTSYSSNEIIMIDHNRVVVNYKSSLNVGSKEFSITSIIYGTNESIVNSKFEDSIDVKGRLTVVLSDVVRYVSTVDQLKNMSRYYVYKLEANINLIGVSWSAIDFTGVLIGDGYDIINFKNVKENLTYVGLFRSISGGLYDIILSNVDIYVNSNAIDGRLGTLAAYAYNAIISNCTVSGIIKYTSSGEFYIGGIIGQASNTTIKNCNANVNMSIVSTNTRVEEDGGYFILVVAGGVAGYASNVIFYNCSALGTLNIEAKGLTCAGGIAGYMRGSIIAETYSKNNISVNSKTWAQVGGLVGEGRYLNIYDCYSASNVSATGSSVGAYVGGLIGYVNSSDISRSYSLGEVSGNSSSGSVEAGGIAGLGSGDDEVRNVISNCYSASKVTAINSSSSNYPSAGGIVGYVHYYDFYNCYSTGDVKAVNSNNYGSAAYAGGLTGMTASTTIVGSYSTGDILAKSGGESWAGGLVAIYTTNSFITNSYRYEEQSVQAISSNNYYNHIQNEGSSASMETIYLYTYVNWDKDVWNLSLTENPTLK